MERRLFAWVVVSTAFVFIYVTLNVVFGPPRVGRPNQQVVENQAPEAVEDPPANFDHEKEGSPGLDQESDEKALQRDPERFTLGSFDSKDGYNLLVTLNSQGAGVERIEMTERNDKGRLKYHRVDTRTGYLGYLALTTSQLSDGCRVQIVGPGTPAAIAIPLESNDIEVGLRVGDVIVSANDQPVADPDQLAAVMEKTKPGDTLILAVRRSVLPNSPSTNTEPESESSSSTKISSVPETSDTTTKTVRFEAVLTEHPLDLMRLAKDGGADEVVGNLDRLACLLTLSQVGTKKIPTGHNELTHLPSQHQSVWVVEKKPKGSKGNAEAQIARFRHRVSPSALRAIDASPVELVRTYRLEPGSYAIDMDVSVENKGDKTQKLAYRLNGPSNLTLEGWWYSNKIGPSFFGGAGARDLVYKTTEANHQLIGPRELVKYARDKPKDPDKLLFPSPQQQLHYIGIDAQYFTVAYVPQAGQMYSTAYQRAGAILDADVSSIRKHQEPAANTSFFLDSTPVEVESGKSLTHSFRMFAGPKRQDLLAQYQLSDCIYYGWFGWVSRPLQSVLHFFEWIFGNFAIAIVCLTLLVRGLMFPLGRKAAVHAQKMQELAPELKKINEKHKEDMQARMKAQRELQQKAGFNPLSGCLPMFIQLPIFIGLYRCLSIDIELRQAYLLEAWQWCSNLAGPDMLAYWGDSVWEYLSGRGTGWLGPYFNILPMLVMGLFLVQQKLFMPPATDEQTAMTQKIMTMMTVMMGLFFFRVPSGLCIYFITSSLWGIAERKLVKSTIPEKKNGPVTIDGKVRTDLPTKDSKESKSLTDRIRNKINKESAPPVRPKDRKKPPSKKKR